MSPKPTRPCCSDRRGRATAISISSACWRRRGRPARKLFIPVTASFLKMPRAARMTSMGAKSGSKARREKAVAPLVPGYHGEAQDDATLAKAAEKVGFPVLVKASAGGGGRGMRVVRQASELGP